MNHEASFVQRFISIVFAIGLPLMAITTVLSAWRTSEARAQSTTDTPPLQFEARPLTGCYDDDTYACVNSLTANGPIFEWYDATGGTQILGTAPGDDDGAVNVTLPFSFTFYGTTSRQLRVGNNGAILFGATTGDIAWLNDSLSNAPPNFIAPFWDDLSRTAGGVYVKTFSDAPNRVYVVEWSQRPHAVGGGNVTFEVLFSEATHSIFFEYLDVYFSGPPYDAGGSATVGIKGHTIQYSFDEAVLVDHSAIRFSPLCFAMSSDVGSNFSGPTAVQQAIDATGPGGAVKVAGYCAGVQNRSGTIQTVYISKPLTLRGGYTIDNWAIPDPINNPATLDAVNGGNVISSTADLNIADLTVQNGMATRGAGIFSSRSLTLTDVDVYSNTAGGDGGGVYVGNGTLIVSGTHFARNIANNDGGGFYTEGPAVVTNTRFILNTSNLAGGGLFTLKTLTLVQSAVISNTTASAYGAGAGVYARDGAAIADSLFQYNQGGLSGGLWTDGTLDLTGTQFVGNTAAHGSGGAYAVYATTITGSLFQDNVAGVDGGGLRTQGTLTLTNTQFISNAASGNGGGAHAGLTTTLSGGLFQDNLALITGSLGGGLYVSSGNLNVNGTQFISNTADQSGGGFDAAGPTYVTNAYVALNKSNNGCGGLHSVSVLTLTHSTLISNTARTGNGGGGCAVGGAIVNDSEFENNTGGRGGGLWTGGALTVTDSRFISNTANVDWGGGFDAEGPTNVTNAYVALNKSNSDCGGLRTPNVLTLTHSTLISNTTVGNGGGGCADSGAMVNDSELENNTGRQGGGLWTNGTLAVTNTRFVSNTATVYGGGAYAASASLTSDQFINNTSQYDGGGAYVYRTGTIIGGRFENNRCTNATCGGGGLNVDRLILTGTLFIDNNAAGNGGGAYVWDGFGAGPSRIVNALFARNSAGSGAALYLLNQRGSPVTILHNTIASPALGSGTALVINQGLVGITDTIVTNYMTGVQNLSDQVYEDYNLFYGNGITVTGAVSGGAHDVIGDPRFVNAAADNYHLAPDSTARDAGINAGVASDLDGHARPFGPGFDIGAYEYTHYTVFLPIVLK